MRSKRLHLLHASGSPMTETVASACRIATTGAAALIVGEPGTGKSTIARMIHDNSANAEGPFVPFVCTGLSEATACTLLFGGADDPRLHAGAFGAANRGTLYLQDIDLLPLRAQTVLVRLVDACCREWVQDSEGTPTVRVIASSTRELAPLVVAGQFRRDLYDLLACEVRVPPLRVRPDDALEVFYACWADVGGGRVVDSHGLELIRRHDWPGNVREVEAFSHRLCVSMASVLGAAEVSHELHATSTPQLPASTQLHGAWTASFQVPTFPSAEGFDLVALLRAIESSAIGWALSRTSGNKKEAARLLGLRRTTLMEKLRRGHGPRHEEPELLIAGANLMQGQPLTPEAAPSLPAPLGPQLSFPPRRSNDSQPIESGLHTYSSR